MKLYAVYDEPDKTMLVLELIQALRLRARKHAIERSTHTMDAQDPSSIVNSLRHPGCTPSCGPAAICAVVVGMNGSGF